MQSTIFITVPGLNGSGSTHWQTIAEQEIPNCRRVRGIDFETPVIAAWADAIRTDVRQCVGNVVLIAHSFGCLASVLAIADHDTKVAAVILVAPASPQRFNVKGLVETQPPVQQTLVPGVLPCLPTQPLGVPGVVIGSTNDPWMRLVHAKYWAETWGLRFLWLKEAGHINSESGFGRWQGLHHMACALGEQVSSTPLGDLDMQDGRIKNRFSALSKVRQLTRSTID